MIDAEVAEKVMNWKRPPLGKMWIDGITGEFNGYMQPGATMGLRFEPSTRIDHAWLVVEKMREKGFLADIYHQHRQPDGSYLIEADFTPESGDELFTSIESTAPLAICKAALSALSAKEE